MDGLVPRDGYPRSTETKVSVARPTVIPAGGGTKEWTPRSFLGAEEAKDDNASHRPDERARQDILKQHKWR